MPRPPGQDGTVAPLRCFVDAVSSGVLSLKDSATGWATIAGNQGTPFLVQAIRRSHEATKQWRNGGWKVAKLGQELNPEIPKPKSAKAESESVCGLGIMLQCLRCLAMIYLKGASNGHRGR